MNEFFDKRIIIESNKDISIEEEEEEICDLAKQVLTRHPKDEHRKVRVIEDIEFITKDL